MFAALIFVLLFGSQDPAMNPGPIQESAEQAQAAAAPVSAARERESRIICRREPIVGSNRSRRVCEREGVIDHNRQQAQRWHENIMSGNGVPDCDTSPEHCSAARKAD